MPVVNVVGLNRFYIKHNKCVIPLPASCFFTCRDLAEYKELNNVCIVYLNGGVRSNETHLTRCSDAGFIAKET